MTNHPRSEAWSRPASARGRPASGARRAGGARLRGAGWFGATALGILLCSVAQAVEVQVMVSGKYAGTMDAYKVGETYYLNARQIGPAYGGQSYYYPVTGRVQLSLRGHQARLLIDSQEAQLDGKALRLSTPVLLRASQAFIPLEFFLSREFTEMAGVDSQFNPETRLLSVDRRTSVGPLRWFSYADHTRIVLEVARGLTYSVTKRGRAGFDIVVPMGRIDWSENATVDDGVLRDLRLLQEPKLARLIVRLDAGAALWEYRQLEQPRRVVVDIQRALDVSRAEAPRPDGPIASGELGRRSDKAPEAPAREKVLPAAAPGASKKRRIVVDPGHGGKDGGATGRRGTLEKNINLQAARELAELLREEDAFEVLLLRENDSFVPLDERSRRANEFGADLFVSLHCNAAADRRETGFEIYFLSEQASDPESQRLADVENAVLALEGKSPADQEAASLLHAMAKTEFINEAAEAAGLMAKSLSKRVDLDNRGVKQAAFYVLRGTNAPALLVEMGFLTSPRDEAKLESRRYRRRLVEGIYAGILEFAKRRQWFEGKGVGLAR